MHSASPAAPVPSSGDDRTARARIRDAALARFADDGVAATSVRAIADAADVSAGLVIHHFGSKDALRSACDEHVAATIREGKHAAMAQGTGLDPLAALRAANEGAPLMRYLARTLVDGSPHVAALVDELVADAVAYMREGVAAGTLRPTGDAYGRAAVLTAWSLGALVLHEHVERLLGVDLTGDPSEATAYLGPALEMFSDGLLTEAMAERYREAFASRGTPAAPGHHTSDEEVGA
jgi:AcrR family transcriptional regulator